MVSHNTKHIYTIFMSSVGLLSECWNTESKGLKWIMTKELQDCSGKISNIFESKECLSNGSLTWDLGGRKTKPEMDQLIDCCGLNVKFLI